MKKNSIATLAAVFCGLLTVFIVNANAADLTVSLTIIPSEDDEPEQGPQQPVAPAAVAQGETSSGGIFPEIIRVNTESGIGSKWIGSVRYPVIEWFGNKVHPYVFVFYGTTPSYEFGPFRVFPVDGLRYSFVLQNITETGPVYYKIVLIDETGKSAVLESSFDWGTKSIADPANTQSPALDTKELSKVRPFESYVSSGFSHSEKSQLIEKKYILTATPKGNCGIPSPR